MKRRPSLIRFASVFAREILIGIRATKSAGICSRNFESRDADYGATSITSNVPGTIVRLGLGFSVVGAGAGPNCAVGR